MARLVVQVGGLRPTVGDLGHELVVASNRVIPSPEVPGGFKYREAKAGTFES